MLSSGRSVSRSVVTASVRFSSKVKKLDPRTPEFKKQVVPWQHFTPEPANTGIAKFLFHNTSATEAMKYLSTPFDYNKSIISSWWKRQVIQHEMEQQTFNLDRLENLGGDISIAVALAPLGASFLYRGKPWRKGLSGSLSEFLPDSFEEGWILEAIDVSNCSIYYEGFRNFHSLTSLHTIIAQNCPHLDDWCLDIICSGVLGLENFDLSGCKKITPRGLVPLVHLPNLLTLNLSNCPAFETSEGKLMCMLIQEFKKDLTIKGVNLSDTLDTANEEVKISQEKV